MEGEGYNKGKGNAGQKGVHFQLDLITLCLLNALNGQYKYWKISTENTMAGKFDDVVIELDLDSAVLIQAKHKENKRITKDQLLSCNTKSADFSLPKYFFSYEEIKNKFQARTVIICTNTEINTKGLEDVLTRQQAQPYNLLHYEGNCSFYTFNPNILPDLKKGAEAYLLNNPRGKGIDKDMVTQENLKDFLENLQFFSCYPCEDYIHEIIEQSLSYLNSSNLYRNISSQEIRRKVEDWFLQPKGEYLTEARAKAMLCEIRSDKYCVSLRDFNVSFDSNDLDITKFQKITHVKITNGYLLQILKVYYALRTHKSNKLYVNPDDAIDVQKLGVEAFSVRRYKFLIMVWDAIKDETAKTDIINIVRRILEGDKYKQVILVADISAKLAQQFGLEYTSQIDGSVTLQDLSKDSQARLLKTENVLFQGHTISLDTLLYTQVAEDYTKSLVDSAMLEGVVRGKETKVGEPLLDLNEDTARYYVSRRFEARIDEAGHTRNILSEKNLYDLKEKMIVISDSAGMGKSTVITKMAMTIKETNPNLWVIKVNLSDYTKVLKDFVKMNKTEINAAELLNSQEATKITNKFEELVFSMTKKVVLMLDGADEVSPDYTDLVLSLLNHCQKASNFAKIFVSTRPHVNLMQKEVGLFQMLPFSEMEQIDFLTNYWIHNLNLSHDHKDECKRYAETLIRKIGSWTKSNHFQQHFFADIPLQARMLADIFQENGKSKASTDWEGCKEYLERDETEIKLPERFNIAKLYDRFIEKKRDIFIEKGSPDGSVTATQALLKQFESCLDYHRSLAVRTILPSYKQLFKTLIPEDRDAEEFMLKIGIVQRLGDRVHFIHRTFAEYFLAESIVQELILKNPDAYFQRLLIDRIFRNDKFNIVTVFLDVLLDTVSLPTNVFKEYRSLKYEKSNIDLIFKLARDGHVGILRLILENVDFKVVEGNSVNLNDWRIKSSIWNRNTLNGLAVLVRQAGVNIKREDGETPLHLAVKEDHSNMVDFLLKQGADVNMKNGRKQMALQLLANNWKNCNLIKSSVKYNLKEDHFKIESINWDIVKCLVEHGADATLREPVLHIAVLHGSLDVIAFLLKHGTQINMRGNENVTALHVAAYRGNLNIVKYLVEHGADVNASDDEGLTALHVAAKFDKKDIIEYFLKHQVDINIKSRKNYTPLHVATFEENLDVIKYLVEHGADVNMTDSKHNNVLHIATGQTNLKIVKYLVENRVDVNVGDGKGLTTLHLAAKFNSVDIVEYLLEHGAYINMKSSKDDTALHIAVYNKNWSIVKVLIDHGADVNAGNDEGLTALHLAAEFNEIETAEYLFKHGAAINMKNSNDKTPLYVATYNENWSIVKYLVEHGADPNGPEDDDDLTALHVAVKFKETHNITYLLEHGVDVNVKNGKNNTALHIATYNGNWDIVKFLIQHDADVNGADEDGLTALHFAARFAEMKTMKYLLEQGVAVNIKNIKNDTALHLAVYASNVNVFKYLVEHGADVNARGEKGKTALHLALFSKTMEIADILENGVEVNMKSGKAQTALHAAVYGNNMNIFKYIVGHGADVNVRDEKGNTVLHLALLFNRVNIVDYLLENGADVNMKNGQAETALHLVVYDNKMLKCLVEHGADVNATNKSGNTALHIATSLNRVDIVDYLLENGADINMKNGYDNTVLQNAFHTQNWNLVKVFVEHGADVNIGSEAMRTEIANFFRR